MAVAGYASLNNEKLARFSNPNTSAAMAMVLYPSRCIVMMMN
jgi:hypothetical protein